MQSPPESVDLDFTGIFSRKDLKPAAPPLALTDEVVIGAKSLKKGGYFVNLTHPRPGRARAPAATSILVVEDDPSTQMLLDRVLSRGGFRIRSAASGAGFVAAMKQPPIPDLLILDLELPDVSGFKILTKIREHPLTKQLPVIILSARSEPRDVFEGISLGADGYITKPANASALLQAVKAILGDGGP